jgi:hypothetical protein
MIVCNPSGDAVGLVFCRTSGVALPTIAWEKIFDFLKDGPEYPCPLKIVTVVEAKNKNVSMPPESSPVRKRRSGTTKRLEIVENATNLLKRSAGRRDEAAKQAVQDLETSQKAWDEAARRYDRLDAAKREGGSVSRDKLAEARKVRDEAKKALSQAQKVADDAEAMNKGTKRAVGRADRLLGKLKE